MDIAVKPQYDTKDCGVIFRTYNKHLLTTQKNPLLITSSGFFFLLFN